MSFCSKAARECARVGRVAAAVLKRGLGCSTPLRSLAVALVFCGAAQAQVRYYYDELNRLVEVVAPDAVSVQYAYDAAGNITLVRRSAASALSLTEFTPNGGPVGTAVTLYGSGFSTTIASNTVKFNGVAATVSAATATTLNVTVPTGATTGLITVTVGSASVSSATNFVVGATAQVPTIASFTPQIGSAGTVVTVTGTNFQTAAEDNKLLLGQAAVPLVKDAASPTATQLKLSVPSATTSGKVTVTTPYGKAVSTMDFYGLPASVAAVDFEFKGRITVGGAAVTVKTTAPGKKAVLLFDAQPGQLLHFLSGTSSFTSSIAASVYGPTGILIQSLSLTASTVNDFTQPIAVGGTYTVILTPQPTEQGSISLSMIADATGTLAVDGSAALNLSAGRNARYSFTAEANKGYGLALTGLALTPSGGNVTVTLRKADGTPLFSCSFSGSDSCDFAPSNFAGVGTYLIDFDPSGMSAAAFTAVLSKDIGGTITVDAAAATTVTIARAGQNASYTFSGTAGQNISAVLTGSTLDDGDAATNNNAIVYLYAPSSATNIVASTYMYSGTNSATLDFALPETGTYTVFIGPSGLDKGAVSLQVKSYLTGTLAVDGGTAINLSAGRNARYSFTAEANKGYGMALTGLAFTPAGGYLNAVLRKADGTSLFSCAFYASDSCDFAPSNFPAAGTYYVDFDPQGNNAAVFTAVLSKDTGGATTVDAAAATAVTITRAGQNGSYTFSGTAGQNISAVLTGSTLDDGDSATNNYTNVYLYAPSSATTVVAATYFYSGTNSATLDFALPETGTYTVFIGPSGLDKGAISLQVKSYLTGTLAVDGGTAINLSAGRNARYSFTAAANKGYGLAVTGLAFTPAGGSLNATLRAADGTYLSQCSFSSSDSCDFSPTSFPTAGTYLIDFDPAGTSAAAFTAVLSKDTGGAITVDSATATAVTIARAGQNGSYTFSGTAGQNISAVLTGSTLDDGDAATNNATNVYLYAPSSATNIVAATYFYPGTNTATLDFALPETGTYTVFIGPSGLDKGAVGLRVTR